MNKTELVAAIAEKAELSKKDSEKALKAFIDTVTDELKKGEKIVGNAYFKSDAIDTLKFSEFSFCSISSP